MKLIYLMCIVLFLNACGTDQSQTSDSGETDKPDTSAPAIDEKGLIITDETLADGKTLPGNYTLDGKKNGTWSTYYPHNGALKTITTYVQDNKEGWYLEFKDNNYLSKRIMYHDNQRHGEYKEYSFSAVKEERFYQNGKVEGIAKIYYDDGKIQEEGSFKNGQRDGVSKWYDQNGNVTIEYEYNNGTLVKK